MVDMIGSRKIPRDERTAAQMRFLEVMNRVNGLLLTREELAASFSVTAGDEFIGLLRTPCPIPDLIWEFSAVEDLPPLRVAFGYGEVDTSLELPVNSLDGPVFHNGRAAMDLARAERRRGGVFLGFGPKIDATANGIAGLLNFHLETRTPLQRRVIGLLRSGLSQVETAQVMGTSPQIVWDHKEAAGWRAFEAGEDALRAILSMVNLP